MASTLARAMRNEDRAMIRKDLTFTGMATATPADPMVGISPSKPIATGSFVAMTKVSGATAATMAIVEATAATVAFPGKEPTS